MIQTIDFAPLDGITKVVFRQVWHRRFGGVVRSRCRGGKRQPGQGHPEQAEGDGKGAQGVKQAENYFPHGENHSFPAGLSSGSMRKNAAPETEVHNFHTGMLYFTGGSVLC